MSQGIDHTADQGISQGNLDDPFGSLNQVSLLDEVILSEEGYSDVILLQVENHPKNVMGKFQEFSCHGLFQAMNPGNPITDGQYHPRLTDIDLPFVASDLFFDDATDFFSLDLHKTTPSPGSLGFV